MGMFSAIVLLASGIAMADDTKITTRADAVKAMTDVAASMDKQSETFTRYADAAQKVAGLYTSLDAQATKLAKLSAQCVHGCSKETQSQLDTATKDLQSAQMSFSAQYLQLQNQMQNENRQYSAVHNIMKTKHDTVKNSISNIR
jgi:hypothetical protein